jgi:vancomycin permeability regulator SanA
MGGEGSKERRRNWGVRLLKVALVVAAFAIAYVVITFVQVWTSTDGEEPVAADAVVVLGAAQYDGRPSPVLAKRLDRALELYEDGYADTVITTGSRQEGDRFTEGYAGFEYLRGLGVEESSIEVVVDGDNTYEQLAATANLLSDLEDPSVLIVTDPYHSMRVGQIAGEVGLAARVVTTDGSSPIASLMRETAAVSIGRVLGYRRLSNLG